MKFLCGVEVGIRFSNAVYQLSFNFFVFIFRTLRKFKINNKACTSFKIEKIKLPLTMPHPRADLLLQMHHPGEDKVVKCPTNARGGVRAFGIDETIKVTSKWVSTSAYGRCPLTGGEKCRVSVEKLPGPQIGSTVLD